jgi:hypothetical protein
MHRILSVSVSACKAWPGKAEHIRLFTGDSLHRLGDFGRPPSHGPASTRPPEILKAMTDLARQSFTVTRHAFDARADYGRRTIHMSMTQVSIERIVDGIKMCIAVPVANYEQVSIRVRAPSGSATLTLCHGSDRDLDVVLATGDGREVTIAAKAWAAVLEKPIVVEAGVVILPSQPRTAAKPVRPIRRTGNPARMQTSFAGEREIIART